MKTSLFIILPTPSHYHAAFGLANEIRNSGQRVIFTGTFKVRDVIEDEDFEYLYFEYLTEYIILNFKVFSGILIKSLVDKTYLSKRYRNFLSGMRRLNKVLEQTNPDHIYIDEHLSEYAIYLSEKKILMSILCTKLSSRRAKGVPPMNSYFVPDNSRYSNLICEILWFRRWLCKMWSKWIIKIAFCGNDEASFIQKWKRNINFSERVTIDEYNYYFKGIVGIPRIILGTNSLEFTWRLNFEDEKYFFNSTYRCEERFMTEEYRKFIDRIRLERLVDEKKIIYCSFGTVSYKNTRRISLFMEKLLSLKSDLGENMILVISKGKLPFEWPRMKDAYYFDYLPQLDFLNHCDLMITHGGHNSIKECYQKGVKMLVYPYMEDYDQPGNAIRVESKGFGLMGNLEKDNACTIWSKISYCLHNIDKPRIPQRG